MSTERDSGLCRCCHSRGFFERLANTCSFNNNESYCSLVKSFLGIHLLPLSGDLCKATYLICEECIMKLKSVLTFRQQVQRCEDIIHNMYTYNTVASLLVKKENDGSNPENDKPTEVLNESKIKIEVDIERETNDEETETDIQGQNQRENTTEKEYSKKATKHFSKNSENSLLCNFCKQSFTHEYYFIKHKFKIHSQDDRYICDVCTQSFYSKICLTEHLKKHFKQERFKYKCTKCKYKTGNLLNLEFHEKNHERILRCTICDIDFDDNKKMLDHNSQIHNVFDKFQCELCFKPFFNCRELSRHLASEHKDYKHTCKLCNFTTSSAESFKKHNSDHKKLCCKLCNSIFPTEVQFTKHKLEIHNVDDRSKCKDCNKYFNFKGGLRKHNNTFHKLGSIKECQHCDFQTYNATAMSDHKIKHKTVKEFVCKYCDKAFLRRQTWKMHVRIHTNDRQKVCKDCGQAFVQNSSLNYEGAFLSSRNEGDGGG